MNIEPNAMDDMLADLGVSTRDTATVRSVLNDIAALAGDAPEPSPEVRVLLSGAAPLRPRHRAAFVAAAAGALALGGVSAAAAANRLPDPIQEIVANATEGVLPVSVPHPVKPANPPYDAPGHVRNKPKAPKPTPSTSNTDAPGQIQKATKPDPSAPGPARPADPGSHGRARNADRTNDGTDRESDDSGDADRGGTTDSDHGKPRKD
jgi:hypothetical protein